MSIGHENGMAGVVRKFCLFRHEDDFQQFLGALARPARIG